MHFVFLTRCTRPENLPKVKQSVRDVFSTSLHTYHHVLIPDVSESNFEPFNNAVTDVFYASHKESNDAYMTKQMDDVLSSIPETDGYVYVLDDDNELHPSFLSVAAFCDSDAVVFKTVGHPEWGVQQKKHGKYIGRIDWCNYVTKLSVMRELKIFVPGMDSHDSDGRFFERMIAAGCSVRFVDRELAFYNHLSN